MPSNTAIVVQKPGEAIATEASIPKLRDDYILVKTKAVALNPTDWKHIEWLTSNGARVRLSIRFLRVHQALLTATPTDRM